MDHSIVIPTRNHPERLAVCLASILEARSSSWEYEVLVMDNSDPELRASNAAVVDACADGRVRYIPMTEVGLMAARHQGVEAARSTVASFIDDDELLCPGWFEGVRSCLRDPRVALVTGPFVPKYEGKPPSWLEYLWQTDRRGRYLGFLTLLDYGDVERDIEPIMVWGGNLTIRKQVFEEVRGSHPDFIPSPWEAYQGDGEGGLTVKVAAAGYRARYSPDCAVLHAVPAERMTLEYLSRRAWIVGVETSFTQSRRENGLGAGAGVPVAPVVQKRPLPRRAAGRVSRRVKSLMARALLPTTPVGGPEKTAVDVRRQLAEAHREGYRWHRERLASMSCLREYVSRPDFLGVNAVLPRQTGLTDVGLAQVSAGNMAHAQRTQ
jgi:glucosyl-dolichyl phosphate glucuronosyltransferase